MTGGTPTVGRWGDTPPLAETLARLHVLESRVHARLGVPEGDGWLAAEAIVTDGLDRLDPVFAGMRKRYGARADHDDIVVGFFAGHYAWYLASVGVAAFLVDARVPALGRANLRFHLGEHGFTGEVALASSAFAALPDDPARDEARVTMFADRARLRDHLHTELETHLAPVLAALGPRARLGARAAWLAASDMCASVTFGTLGHLARPNEAEAEIAALLLRPTARLAGPPGLGMARHPSGGLRLQRGSCCRNFRLPGQSYCANCPLLPECQWLRRAQPSHPIARTEQTGATPAPS